MKKLIPIVALVLLSCTSSQQTMYRVPGESAAWSIEVKRSPHSFELFINGTSVTKGDYPFWGSDFVADGTYRGKKIRMTGHRISKSSGDESITIDNIRILVDDSEVTYFQF